ncbi:MAG: hypothetical protein HC913_20915 [Microscillaceae bacterium]|nr:hypothetical protein [Microscillaceae bacterium]
MQAQNLNPNPREVVWTINKNTSSNQSPASASKAPVRIKELIDRTFQQLSQQLLERIGQLEMELQQLRTENQSLQKQLEALPRT